MTPGDLPAPRDAADTADGSAGSDPTELPVPIGTLDPAAAVARYVEIAPRLPPMPERAVRSVRRTHLGELVDEFDAFVLDGFGVLNVGNAAVEGAAERVAALRAAGKAVRVLTNGATFPTATTLAKYLRWNIAFAREEVVSSRDALAEHLAAAGEGVLWGFAARASSEIEGLAPRALLLGDEAADYARAEGFVLLSSGEWDESRQRLLAAALAERPRPVLVGNPDLVAPFAAGLSQEPGLYAHALADASVAAPVFFGKPFAEAFALVARTLEGIAPERVAMVGDTLHTDILGGAAFGWRTVLVVEHGLMKTLDVEAAIAASGVRPDFIVATT